MREPRTSITPSSATMPRKSPFRSRSIVAGCGAPPSIATIVAIDTLAPDSRDAMAAFTCVLSSASVMESVGRDVKVPMVASACKEMLR